MIVPSAETSSGVKSVLPPEHPEATFPENAIAHAQISLSYIEQQIRVLEDEGTAQGWVEASPQGKRTYYYHVYPGTGSKDVRKYLKKAYVSTRRAEIARGREVRELKEIAEQVREAIARLDRVQGLNASEPLRLERSSGRVEGAIAL